MTRFLHAKHQVRVSRQISAAIVDRLRKATPSLEIVYRDLASQPLSHRATLEPNLA